MPEETSIGLAFCFVSLQQISLKVKLQVFVNKYEPTLADHALGAHTDECKCASQVICLKCAPEDEFSLELLIDGTWIAQKLTVSTVLTLSRQVYHRIKPVNKERIMMILFW